MLSLLAQAQQSWEGEAGGNSKLHVPTMTAVALGVPEEGNVRNDRVSKRKVSLRIQSFKYLLRASYGSDAILGIGNPCKQSNLCLPRTCDLRGSEGARGADNK